MSITVRYFAVLREQRGLSEETIECAAGTPQDLYEVLREQHGFTLNADQIRVVINEAFSSWDDPISEGDTVVFVPPVAGG